MDQESCYSTPRIQVKRILPFKNDALEIYPETHFRQPVKGDIITNLSENEIQINLLGVDATRAILKVSDNADSEITKLWLSDKSTSSSITVDTSDIHFFVNDISGESPVLHATATSVIIPTGIHLKSQSIEPVSGSDFSANSMLIRAVDASHALLGRANDMSHGYVSFGNDAIQVLGNAYLSAPSGLGSTATKTIFSGSSGQYAQLEQYSESDFHLDVSASTFSVFLDNNATPPIVIASDNTTIQSTILTLDSEETILTNGKLYGNDLSSTLSLFPQAPSNGGGDGTALSIHTTTNVALEKHVSLLPFNEDISATTILDVNGIAFTDNSDGAGVSKTLSIVDSSHSTELWLGADAPIIVLSSNDGVVVQSGSVVDAVPTLHVSQLSTSALSNYPDISAISVTNDGTHGLKISTDLDRVDALGNIFTIGTSADPNAIQIRNELDPLDANASSTITSIRISPSEGGAMLRVDKIRPTNGSTLSSSMDVNGVRIVTSDNGDAVAVFSDATGSADNTFQFQASATQFKHSSDVILEILPTTINAFHDISVDADHLVRTNQIEPQTGTLFVNVAGLDIKSNIVQTSDASFNFLVDTSHQVIHVEKEFLRIGKNSENNARIEVDVSEIRMLGPRLHVLGDLVVEKNIKFENIQETNLTITDRKVQIASGTTDESDFLGATRTDLAKSAGIYIDLSNAGIREKSIVYAAEPNALGSDIDSEYGLWRVSHSLCVGDPQGPLPAYRMDGAMNHYPISGDDNKASILYVDEIRPMTKDSVNFAFGASGISYPQTKSTVIPFGSVDLYTSPSTTYMRGNNTAAMSTDARVLCGTEFFGYIGKLDIVLESGEDLTDLDLIIHRYRGLDGEHAVLVDSVAMTSATLQISEDNGATTSNQKKFVMDLGASYDFSSGDFIVFGVVPNEEATNVQISGQMVLHNNEHDYSGTFIVATDPNMLGMGAENVFTCDVMVHSSPNGLSDEDYARISMNAEDHTITFATGDSPSLTLTPSSINLFRETNLVGALNVSGGDVHITCDKVTFLSNVDICGQRLIRGTTSSLDFSAGSFHTLALDTSGQLSIPNGRIALGSGTISLGSTATLDCSATSNVFMKTIHLNHSLLLDSSNDAVGGIYNNLGVQFISPAGNITAPYDISINTDLFVGNDVEVINDLSIGGDIFLGGNLRALNGDLLTFGGGGPSDYIEGDFTVTQDISLGGTVNVGGDVYCEYEEVRTDLSVGNDLFVGGGIYDLDNEPWTFHDVNGDFTVSDDLSVGGALLANGDAFVKLDLSVGNDLIVLGNIVASSLSADDLCGTLLTAAQPHITSLGTITTLSAGTVAATNLGGTLTTAAQPNITSLGTITTLIGGSGTFSSLTVDTSSIFVDATNHRVGINTITPGYALDVNGTANATSLRGTIITAAQPNITSLGTITTLIGGSGTFSSLTVDTSSIFVDATNHRVGINTITPGYALDVNGTANATNLRGTIITAAQPNITSLGTITTLNAGTVSATNLGGTLSTAAQPNITSLGTITTLNAGTVSATNLGGTLSTAAQPNVTSLGALTTLNVQHIDTQTPAVGSNAINITANTISGSAAHRWLKFLSQSSPLAYAGIQFSSFSQPHFAIVNDGSFRIGYNTTSLGASTATREVAQDWSAFTEALNITSAGVTNIATLAVTNTITNKQTPKAFINFNGSGTIATNNSFNVASLTRNSTCLYTITFTTAMASANYAWFASAGFDNIAQSVWVSSPITSGAGTPMSTWKTTTSLQLQAVYANAVSNTNPHDFNIIVYN